MSRERLKAIFIEEANEIIEKLDSDIINFEENPNDKDLLNELFRGVHTLKGNANAFGFTRLGGFVHHLEDLLDYYRSSPTEISSNTVDLMLDAVDVIKEVQKFEVDGIDGIPNEYDACLQRIIENLNLADNEEAPKQALNNLADEFADEICEIKTEEKMDISNISFSTKFLYLVELKLDKDIYFRGYDHLVFFKQLADIGTIIESTWECSSIPALDSFNPDDSLFTNVSIICASDKSSSEIEEIFEFLFDNEWSVAIIGENIIDVPAPIEKPIIKVDAQNTIKPKEVKEAKEEAVQQKSYIKIDTSKLDELFDSVGELVIAQNFIAQNDKIKSLEDSDIQKTIETLTKITKVIQDRVMSLRMVAIRDTFERMKRVARDTAKKTGKEIKLIIQGEDTEIDKTMIDNLSDPIVHMIRNAIDHGLESSAQERLDAGKDKEGLIALKAYHKNGSIVIAISDDGRGISKEKVIAKAIDNGLIASSENMTDAQIFGLIMQPGFSTADKISDISGRGVGLDVVKTSIEKLRGKVEISSEEGRGSTFSIILPLTLAIIDGMLVKSGGEIFIIPTLSVVESFVPDKSIVHLMKGRGEFVDLRNDHVPIIRLNEALGLSDTRPEIWESTLVCVESDQGRFAILVDELVGRQQVVIKTLGKTLTKIKEISGGAILGNGDIALILNIEGLCAEGTIVI